LARAAVNVKGCQLAIALKLLLVASFKSPIYPITDPNPPSIHLTRDSIFWVKSGRKYTDK
jgi:hypothetical protein